MPSVEHVSQSSLDIVGTSPTSADLDAGTTVEVANGHVTARLTIAADHLSIAILRKGRPVIDDLTVGFSLAGTALGDGSTLVRVVQDDLEIAWTPRTGKSTRPHAVTHREATIDLRHRSGIEWRVLLRVAPDGVAVRYAIPDLLGVSAVSSDGTSFDLPPEGRAWVLDYQTWYETPRRGVDVDSLDDGDYGLPVLVRTEASDPGSDHVLVTESAIDGRFSGAHAQVADHRLRFALADTELEIARGEVSPWRVFIVGSVAEVVESLLVDELAPAAPPERTGAAWVRPGRAAWSWWSGFFSGAQLDSQRHFVDVAAELGWEHLLIDCGWVDTWVPEIVAYASQRGIQVHLWTVWHDLDGPAKIERLALWRSWGVAGIKVDFMESEHKDRYRWYDSVLAETDRLGLMVNFHGSVIPRGWARTWPHVVSYEAIRGAEYYVFYDDTPLTAAHNVIQPFTRNVIGAMDYTPVAFTAPKRSTSDGHELGLSVAFESGITHFADHVDEYLARPLVARFLSELAPSWDETRLLAGSPDAEAVVARRSGDRWFIGLIASGPARTVRVPLERLGLPSADVWVVADEPSGRGLREFQHASVAYIDIDLAVDGGAVAIVAAVGAELFRASPRAVDPEPLVDRALIELEPDGTALIGVAGDAELRLPPGWHADRLTDAGHWAVSSPAGSRPGSVHVVTVERGGSHGIPVIAHVRLVAPLTPGEHRVSTLNPLAFRNESGPIEIDMSNGGGNPRDGRRLIVAGREYDDGFGASTPSTIDLHLGARAALLVGEVGVDDETPDARAVAVVSGDGRELARFAIESGASAVPVAIDVTGVHQLTLAAAPLDHSSATPAHIDWASLRLHVPAPTSTSTDTGPADHR